MRALLILALAVVGSFRPEPAFAIELAGGEEEVLTVSETEAPAEHSGVEVASAPSRTQDGQAPPSWLRQESPGVTESPVGTPQFGLGSGLAIVVLLALAAAAAYARFGKASWLKPPNVLAALSPTQARVISSAKLGPKAQLVTVALDDRFMLLGVTEHNVSNLGWLDVPLDSPSDSEVENTQSETTTRPQRRMSSAEQRFGDALSSAFRLNGGQLEPTANVASLLADRTEDVFQRQGQRRPRPAEEESATREPKLEAQVAGLARKRR